MENQITPPCGTETVAPGKAAAFLSIDFAKRKDGDEAANSPVEVSLSASTTEIAEKKLSPGEVPMQENGSKAPIPMPAKTPNSGGRLSYKPLRPFRERNMEEGKRLLLPPHITVPPKKLFGYPERYRSPTDAMVSPVSRGLLTRNRRPSRTMSSPVVPPKALENTFQDVLVDAMGAEVA